MGCGGCVCFGGCWRRRQRGAESAVPWQCVQFPLVCPLRKEWAHDTMFRHRNTVCILARIYWTDQNQHASPVGKRLTYYMLLTAARTCRCPYPSPPHSSSLHHLHHLRHLHHLHNPHHPPPPLSPSVLLSHADNHPTSSHVEADGSACGDPGPYYVYGTPSSILRNPCAV